MDIRYTDKIAQRTAVQSQLAAAQFETIKRLTSKLFGDAVDAADLARSMLDAAPTDRVYAVLDRHEDLFAQLILSIKHEVTAEAARRANSKLTLRNLDADGRIKARALPV